MHPQVALWVLPGVAGGEGGRGGESGIISYPPGGGSDSWGCEDVGVGLSLTVCLE